MVKNRSDLVYEKTNCSESTKAQHGINPMANKLFHSKVTVKLKFVSS